MNGDCRGGEVFALRVLGHDMAPEFNHGEIIMVEPDGALRDGSFVLAELADGWTLRQLCRRGNGWALRVHGLGKPAPFRQMDLLRVARQQFKFASNRLDYVAQALEVGQKTKHEGHELWVKCMNGDPSAWYRMEK